jgi:hypothetical protein
MTESYIGKAPQYGYFRKQSATGDGSTVAFSLDIDAADATQLLVSVGGVIQEANSAYTINASGNILTFTEAPAASMGIFIIWLGKQLASPRIMSDSITAHTDLGAIPASDDYFVIYDTDVSEVKKVAYSNVHVGIADMPANSVKVRDANTTGTPSDKTVADTQLLIGDGTGFTAATLSSDVTMANTGAVTIAADAVTYAKMQNLGTANRVLGSASTGVIGEVQIATDMVADNAVTLAKMAGLVRGKIIVGDASGDPSALTVGTADQVLTSNGTDAVWADSVGGAAWVIKTAAYTAVAGDGVMVDTSSSAITITLPAAGVLGDFVRIMDVTGDAATNNITVGRAGHNIQGAAANLTIATNRAAIGLVYANATEGWVLIEN